MIYSHDIHPSEAKNWCRSHIWITFSNNHGGRIIVSTQLRFTILHYFPLNFLIFTPNWWKCVSLLYRRRKELICTMQPFSTSSQPKLGLLQWVTGHHVWSSSCLCSSVWDDTFVCLFVCLQKQSEDTVTYSTIMQLSGGEDQNSARPAGRPVDPNDLYATVQKNNKIQN